MLSYFISHILVLAVFVHAIEKMKKTQLKLEANLSELMLTKICKCAMFTWTKKGH